MSFGSPIAGPETEHFWSHAKQGRLLLKHCNACGENHFYPRTICPHCFSDDTSWQETSGQGTIYSRSVLRRTKVPYCIAYVTLDEGPTMLTNIVDCDLDTIEIGQRVQLTFKLTADGQALPVFTIVQA